MVECFTVQDALASGMPRGAVYGRRLGKPFRGVRSSEPTLVDHVAKCRAYALLGRASHTFSHHSAAVIHGFPLPFHQLPEDVHVAVFSPEKPPQMRGVIAHELLPAGHRIVAAEGMRCFSPEDTWAQLSRSLTVEELVVIGDWLVTGDEPYSGTASGFALPDLERALRHHGRRPGVQRLRDALELVRYGSLSPQETRLRLHLVAAGLPEPALNHVVQHHGQRVAMVDLAYPERRLAIEYLGDHHRTDQATFREDIHRRERLSSAGWNTVFLTADDLHGPVPRAVLTVRRALASQQSRTFSS
jgi:very-short-patch-repair endonuclease